MTVRDPLTSAVTGRAPGTGESVQRSAGSAAMKGGYVKRGKPIYPPGWKAFSVAIRYARAEGQCECTGECGLHKTHPGPRRCVERDRTAAIWAKGIVVLTVAHLCRCEPLCADERHVKAMCNRCHLRTDIPLHRQHTAEQRRRERETLGQTSFLDLPGIAGRIKP
jgi:hypothetical protein